MKFVIIGRPKAKDRPRVTVRYGMAFAYTPKATKDFEKRVALEYKIQGGKSFGEVPISVDITFIFKPPTKWNKKEKTAALNGETQKITKPDIDNLIKSILDGLNGVAYDDDNQVVMVNACKIYGEEEKTIVDIREFVSEVKR